LRILAGIPACQEYSGEDLLFGFPVCFVVTPLLSSGEFKRFLGRKTARASSFHFPPVRALAAGAFARNSALVFRIRSDSTADGAELRGVEIFHEGAY